MDRAVERIDLDARLKDRLEWRRGATSKSQTENVVDLWQVDLDCDSEDVASHFELLSNTEKERASRFAFAKDMNRFIVGRGMLRKILSEHLGVAPEKISLLAGRFGKPFLSARDVGIRFNVSHSRGVAVIAVSLDREVGIDIEFVDSSFDVFSVVHGVFSPQAISRLRSLPSNLLADTFFAGWTRKEAVLKAMGDGLSGAEELQSAILSINDKDLPSQMLANLNNRNWSITTFNIWEDLKATLAVEGAIDAIRLWQLAESRNGVDPKHWLRPVTVNFTPFYPILYQ